MKLEIGKTYLDKRGRRVEIIYQLREEFDHPFVGISERALVQTFTPDGRFYKDKEGLDDLEKEAVDESPKLYAFLCRKGKTESPGFWEVTWVDTLAFWPPALTAKDYYKRAPQFDVKLEP